MPEEGVMFQARMLENRDSRFVPSERKLTSGAYLITGETWNLNECTKFNDA